MILTKTQLHKLNQFMVGNGEPVTRDYSGYNKVHYWQMYQLSLLPGLNDLQAYAVVSTLNHYTNTQIKNRKDDVSDTVKYYRNLLNEQCEQFDNNPYLFKLAKKEYDKQKKEEEKTANIQGINIVCESSLGITVHLDGYIPELKDFVKNTAGVSWIREDGLFNIFIEWMALSCFLEFVKDYNYKSDALSAIASNVTLYCDKKGYTAEQNKRQKINEPDYKLVDLSRLSLPFKPYPYQIEDANALMSRTRMLLASEMGCGKTFISVLVGTSIPERKLVIVPESLRLNWVKEIKNVTPDADVQVLYSKDEFHTAADWTIAGYSTASKYTEELANEKFNVVFVDEAHFCKAVSNYGSPDSSRAKAVMTLTQNAKYCYLLTGTPIPTRNKDLYNVLAMLKIKNLPSFFSFGKEYCDGFKTRHGWDFSGSSNAKGLHDLLNPYMIRRLKKDVLPHLKKQRQFIPVEMNQKKLGTEKKKLAQAETSSNFLAEAMTVRRLMSEQKVAAAMDLCDAMLEEGRSIVMVSNFTETINTIKAKYKEDCCTVVGGMTDSAKQAAVDDFQSKRKHVCAVNIIAGGVGITLTAANTMIICDFDWTPANMIQVEDRICRSGQTQFCNIYYMYGFNEPIEEYFVGMLSSKSQNIDYVVDKADATMNLLDVKQISTSRIIQDLKKILCKAEKNKLS